MDSERYILMLRIKTRKEYVIFKYFGSSVDYG